MFGPNRPFEPGLPEALQTKLRNRQLFSFLIIGAPLVLFSIRKSGLLGPQGYGNNTNKSKLT